MMGAEKIEGGRKDTLKRELQPEGARKNTLKRELQRVCGAAGFQRAVSQVSNLQVAGGSETPRYLDGLPIGNRRNSRLATCATSRGTIHSGGFSLLEILVAVGLLSVIIVGLMAMFYQTEKAFRIGTRQVDVLESGRSVMELLVRELQEMTTMDDTRLVNFYAGTELSPLVQKREGLPQVNILQDYYFVVKSNDLWTGIGYYLDPVGNGGVGTLYRYSSTEPNLFPGNPINLTNLYFNYTNAVPSAPTNGAALWNRMADNIIHLRIVPYDGDGRVYTNIDLLKYTFPYEIAPNEIELAPSSIDLELAILEPRALERYRAIVDPIKADEFLTNSTDKVHIFRQRIPIRTSQ